MSDYSPPPRPGFTKTGQSIKAVRRYYAMKDAAKKKKPRDDNDEADERPARDRTTTKRRRTPDDDKLSKRIAAEIQVQKDANEKRAQHEAAAAAAAAEARRSASVRPSRGPIFVSEPPEPPEKSKSSKSVRSAKSPKSNSTAARIVTNPQSFDTSLASSSIGFVVSCLVLACVYVGAWIVMIAFGKMMPEVNGTPAKYYSLNSVRWQALSSLVVVVSLTYWLMERHLFRSSLIALVMMLAATVSIGTQLIYPIVVDFGLRQLDNKSKPEYIRNPINFCLSVVYLMSSVLAIAFMIKQIVSLISKQMENKSGRNAYVENPQMSDYLAPS